MQPTNASTSAAASPEGQVTASPELIQHLLEHDYLKLKMQAQVEELVSAKLSRWRAGLIGAISATVVILSYLGVEANQMVKDAMQKMDDATAKAHEAQDKVKTAEASVEATSTRVKDLISDARDNAQHSYTLVASSQQFLKDNMTQLGTVTELAGELRQELAAQKTEIESGKRSVESSTDEARQVLAKVNPLIPPMERVSSAMESVSGAAEEARKAGTFEIVFLESNSDRTIVLPNYSQPEIRYRVKFTTNHIKARAGLDVSASILGGREFPVQHLTNLVPGEIRNIENTSLRVEVSAVRHHRQPFLHSFLILRVISARPVQEGAGIRNAMATADLKTE